MIDVGKELESYRAWFDKVDPAAPGSYEKNLIHAYLTGESPFAEKKYYDDKVKLGKLLAEFYIMGIIWTKYYDEAACGNLDKYLEKSKYKTI